MKLFITTNRLGIGLLFFALTHAVNAQNVEEVDAEPWTHEEIPYEYLNKLKLSQIDASNILFDAVDDIKLFDLESGDWRMSYRLKRRVFDNHDILNSWTVVDMTNLNGRVPFFEHNSDPFSIWFGTNHGIQIMKIRQVLPDNIVSLPPTEEWSEDKAKLEEFAKEHRDDEDWIWDSIIDENGNSLISFIKNTPENKARFSKLTDLVLLPKDLPFSVKSAGKMEDGEIISYKLSGGLEFGASVGWSYEPSGSISTQLGASYKYRLQGEYQVSVLKENDRYFKIKVTRVGKHGPSVNVGDTHKPNFLDGVFLLEHIQGEFKVVPFRFTYTESEGSSFKVGYRYDLENPHAREAFVRALRGLTAMSDELSVDKDGNWMPFEEFGVQKIFTRKATFDETGVYQHMRLTFLYEADTGSSIRNVEAKITLPDGTYRTFDSLVRNEEDWKLRWGAFEKSKYNFTISADLNRFSEDPNADDIYMLTAEGSIDDSHAKASELIDYIVEAENAVGVPGIFPRPPQNHELEGKEKGPFSGAAIARSYGRARIYYRLKINQSQLETFIDTPEEEMWLLLEKAFKASPGSWTNEVLRSSGYLFSGFLVLLTSPLRLIGDPLNETYKIFHATNVYKMWNEAKKRFNPKDRVRALGELFYSSYFSDELIHLLRLSLDGEKVDYTVSGYSPAFGGTVWEEGETQLNSENLATKFQREIDFDRVGPRTPTSEGGTLISNANIEILEDNAVRLDFELEKKPSAVFIEVHERSGIRPRFRNASGSRFRSRTQRNPRLGHFILSNEDLLDEGFNELYLDDRIKDWRKISEQFKSGSKYRLRVAINVAGVNWGPVTNLNFYAE